MNQGVTGNQSSENLKKSKSKLSWFHHQLIKFCKRGDVPKHVAFVMDGNRRFARNRNLSSVLLGHEKGFDALLFTLEICLALGVKIVTVYAFSEDNFSRSAEEVSGLMKLAKEKFEQFLEVEEFVMREGVIIDIWGRPERLSPDVSAAAAGAVLGTMNNSGKTRLNICFAYSGNEEIARSFRIISQGLLRKDIYLEDVTSDLITKCTYLGNLPPPDMLIRTSGETRLSDFLNWHVGETELYFLDVLWPDLSSVHLLACILDWQLSYIKKSTQKTSEEPGPNKRVEKFLEKLGRERIDSWKLYLPKEKLANIKSTPNPLNNRLEINVI